MNAPTKQRGFTLVELMVTIASATVLMLLISVILFLGYLSWRINGQWLRMQEDASLAFRMISEAVHESSPGDITAVNGSLTFEANVVRPDEIAFVQSGDVLWRYVNGAEAGRVIREHLVTFNPRVQTNGVLLEMELTSDDPDADITMKHAVFINSRNRL
jgi:prepilin-type N-terminal cleavage/methylation domain-containing protein